MACVVYFNLVLLAMCKCQHTNAGPAEGYKNW